MFADPVAEVRTATEPKSAAGCPGWRGGVAGTPVLQHLSWQYSGPLHLADDAPAEALWHDGLALPEGEVGHAVASFGSQTVEYIVSWSYTAVLYGDRQEKSMEKDRPV